MAFQWKSLGKPQNGEVDVIDSYLGAVTVSDAPNGGFQAGRDYAFVRGSDKNLWVNWDNGTERLWANQSKLGGPKVTKILGVTTLLDTPQAASRPYAFVLGTDKNLWVHWWNGTNWQWENQQKPADSVDIAGPVGVLVHDGRPYVFVLGGDKNLWVRFFNGTQWQWDDRQKPSVNVDVAGPVGALIHDGRPYVFVLGNDKNLWLCRWTGTEWKWTNEKKPPSSPSNPVDIAGPVGMLTHAAGPYVFVRGSDKNLWLYWWTGTEWKWTKQGNPPGASNKVAGSFGVIRGPRVFVLGDDKNLWEHSWTGTKWEWFNQENPAGTAAPTIASPVGVTAALTDTVYAVGSDKKLWKGA